MFVDFQDNAVIIDHGKCSSFIFHGGGREQSGFVKEWILAFHSGAKMHEVGESGHVSERMVYAI